jgi:hypothetical protein
MGLMALFPFQQCKARIIFFCVHNMTYDMEEIGADVVTGVSGGTSAVSFDWGPKLERLGYILIAASGICIGVSALLMFRDSQRKVAEELGHLQSGVIATHQIARATLNCVNTPAPLPVLRRQSQQQQQKQQRQQGRPQQQQQQRQQPASYFPAEVRSALQAAQAQHLQRHAELTPLMQTEPDDANVLPSPPPGLDPRALPHVQGPNGSAPQHPRMVDDAAAEEQGGGFADALD